MTNAARIYGFVILVGMFLAGGAAAQSGSAAALGGLSSRRLDMIGDAPPGCVLSPPVDAGTVNASLQIADDRSAQVTITELADPETAIPRAATIDLDFPVICNAAHEISVRTARGGLALLAGGAAAPGFRNVLPYRIDVDWAGTQSTGASDTPTPVDIRMGGGAAGLLSVVVNIPEGGDPLVAGSYSDSLIIELLPAN
jgi:hypothetical protein